MKARNNTLLMLAMKSIGLPLIVAVSMAQVAHSQTTVTYTMQDANFPTQFNNGGDFYNSGSTQLGMWANSGSKQTVGWQNFSTTGAAGGTARNLQVGDVFTTTVSATRAFGQIGFSLNAGGTQGTSYANNISGSRMYISTDNYAAWSVKGLSGGGTSSLTYVPIQDTYKDYRFTIRLTSQTTADAYLTVDGVDYRAYNLTLAGSAGANISAFSIFGSDMWDGSSNDDAFWKQTTSVQNSGRVELGYYAGSSSTLTPGTVTDGLAANSTSTTSANAVFIGGDAGSQVNLTQNNTYTGATTINALATAEAQHANSLGTTGAGTEVSNTGTLKLWGGVSYAAEALTLNGLGRAYGDVAGDAGALRSNGGNNTWNGNITLGSSSRINSDTAGGAGSLTIAGNISGGSNVLYLGTKTGASSNIAISGVISGAGGTQNSITTSVFKDGANTLTLSGNNTYSGATLVTAGTLALSGNGTLGSGSVSVTGGTLDLGGKSVTNALSLTSGTVSNGTITNNGSNFDLQSGTVGAALAGTNGVNKTTAGTLYLSGSNSYSGNTTIGGNSIVEAWHANALGSTAAGTSVTNGSSLNLYNASGISYASEALTLNGLGIAGINGALRSTGGNNTWNGNITLGASSRISTDTTGAAGSLTIAGNVAGGSNVLFLGANGANIAISGAISGAGAAQDGTTTSLFKDGVSTLTLSGNNTYSGDTRINVGALTVASGGTLGDGSSDVFISSAGSLNVNTNTTVASVQETGISNGGVIAIGNGAILTVNGADKGTLFQNSISGQGGLTV
ncbi:MAG: autotransporter-associated beta strand repeat-containing protein, partial [Verrucomicrobia bacterium]|nr:autotransporter-associated beta strand repeat-containing protein [Verrucomicrobiota bacterium]